MELRNAMKRKRRWKRYHEKRPWPIFRLGKWVVRFYRAHGSPNTCAWHKRKGRRLEFSVLEEKWFCSQCTKAHGEVQTAKNLFGHNRWDNPALKAAEWNLQQLYNRDLD
jgi:hypothetical protein